MSIGTVFVNNGTQAIRLPAEHSWDTFFLGGASVTDDFMSERVEQISTGRKSF